MKKAVKKYLLLEQLEERIFLDANPLAAVEPVEPLTDSGVEPLVVSEFQVQQMDVPVTSPEIIPESNEPETGVEQNEVTPPADVPATGATEVNDAAVQEEDDTTSDKERGEGVEASTQAHSNGNSPADSMEQELSVEEMGAGADAENMTNAAESADEIIPAAQPSDAADSGSETDQLTEVAAVEAIDPMIGENFTFTVILDNTTDVTDPPERTLYGPYIDLYMPTSGDDGDDGVSYVDASYLGTPVGATIQTFDAAGQIFHPYAVDALGNPIPITGTEGDTYITLEMPFGSFTPDQPAAEVEIIAHIDGNRQVDAGGGAAEDFDIQVYTGYRYGSDPLDNPAIDPPVDPTLVSTQTFRPEVIRFEKVYSGLEQETATGPNYPRQYQISIDIAEGQTINNLELTEHLPNEIYYMGDATVSVNGGLAFSVTSPNAAGGIFTNGILTVELDNPITGTAALNDVVFTFDFYVPQYYAGGVTPILDPITGDDAIGTTEDREVVNDVQVEGDWMPTDPRDRPLDGSPIHISMDVEVNSDGIISPTPSRDELFDAEAIAIQKDVGLAPLGDTGIIEGYNPGDYVQYTLTFQVSDYFNFGNIQITDVLPDGLELQTDNTNGTYTPTFSILDETAVDGLGNPLPWAGNWAVGTDLTTTTQGDDDTELHFDVSAAIIAAGGPDGILQGDLYGNTVLDSPAVGTITYYAYINDEYLSTGDSSGPGDVSVDQGDLFTNSVTIEGQIYGDDGTGTGTLTSTGFDLDQDDSSAFFQIEVGQVYKEIYALNGNTDLSTFTDAQGRLHMQPGDTVTYRLQYYMPTSEFETFRLDDYLPLPVFNAAEITIFDSGESDIAPDAGHWHLHTNDSYLETFPDEPITLQTNTADGENRVSFIFDEHDDTTAQETWIDILFTVTVNDEPFIDGLYLTNQVRGTEDGTPRVLSDSDAIIQIVLDEPVLEITKGIVQSNNVANIYSGNPDVSDYFTEPGVRTGSNTDISDSRLLQPVSSTWLESNNIDTNVSELDAGDTLTVAIVVENTGHADAYDVTLTDVLPLGYTYVVSSLQATNGIGAPLTHSGDLFGAGLIIDDTVDDGSLEGYDESLGTNIMVITYDLVLQDSVGPNQILLNTASITNYGGNEGAGNHLLNDISEDATAQVTDVVVEKSIADTSQPHTLDSDVLGSDVAIGETVTYSVIITVPEGSATSVSFSDVLDPADGLEILTLNHLTADSGLVSVSSSNIMSSIDDAFLASHGTIAADGLSFTIDFEEIRNLDRDNAVSETITLTYTALVRNIANNQNTVDLENTAQWNWTDGNNTLQSASDTETVTVVEPDLVVSKNVDNPNPDEGDTVTFTIVVHHEDIPANGLSTADAFDVVLADTLPAGYDSVAIVSQSGTEGLTGVSDAVTVSGNTLSGSWDVFGLADSYTITLTADLVVDPQAGQILSNTATIDWTSLPEDSDPNERTGTPAPGDPDDYITSSTAVVTVTGAIDKVDPNPSSYTIGDEVQYYILVTLPEGNTNNLIVTDDLPAGMQYVANSHELYTTAGVGTDPSGLLAQDFSGIVSGTGLPIELNSLTGGTGDGMAVSFNYGDIAITADNDPAGENDAFVIGLRALVLNVPGNHDDPDGPGGIAATALINDTYMVYNNPAGGISTVNDPTDPIVSVIEPQISTLKNVVDSADPGDDASPGETLIYTARFTNSGNSTAYEVNALDTLAPGTEFDSYSSISSSFGAADPIMTDNDDGTVSIVADWDMAVGDWVEIQYTVTVMSAGFIAGSYTNTVDADWSSQDGGGTERIYDDSGSSPVDGGLDDNDASFIVDPTASLGDTVFFDAAGNGGPFNSADGDVGISGVRVTISADVDGDGFLEFSDSMETLPDGTYLFSNLAAFDDYLISVDFDGTGGSTFVLEDAGYSPTYDLEGPVDNSAAGISLAPGQNRTDVDFGYTGQNSVGDTVWYDLDNSTTQDTGEDGIGYLTVTISGDIDGDGTAEFTTDTTTDEDGHYSFDYLPAGTYTITVTPPAGTTPTYDLDGTGTANSTDFSLTDDQDRTDIDFGLRGSGSIGDFIWYDGDGEGDQDEGSAAGIEGVTVRLAADIDGDTSIDYEDTTVTAADGSYSFDYLLGGIYTITVDETTLPGGIRQTADPDGTNDSTSTITLAPGTSNFDQDFGYTGLNSVGDFVWFDVNNDGIQDPGEDGIGGVDLIITADIDGDDIDEYSTTATTNGDGFYRFNNLPEGSYTIEVVPSTLPPGAVQTFDYDDGFGASDNLAAFSMDGASDRVDIDFGYRGTGSLGDFLWYDADADGTHDDGPLSGLAGVELSLAADIDGDNTIDYTTTTTTLSDGSYLFEDLLGGSYTITVDTATLPGGAANWHQTYDLDDDTGPFVTPDSAVDVDLGINGAELDRTDVDFGYAGNSSIGDMVFFDADNSGNLSADDTGITDIEVTLTADIDGDGSPDFTWTDVTDENGLYLFENLPAFDSYTVTTNPANLPPGTVSTYDLDGIDTEHVVSGIDLGVNEARDDVDFGYFSSGTGSIGDTVWYDADADGVLDAGEQGLAGVGLVLSGDITGDGEEDISFTTTTDENGSYSFDNLLPGNYTVTVDTRPAGMEQTFDLDGLVTPDNATLDLADGENNNNVDFGYTGSAAIGDTIYFDADNSGTQSAGDGFLPGVTITLTGDVNNDGIEDTLTTMTDANGSYLFENLPDGAYTVTVDPTDLPPGMSQTGDPDGGNDNTSAVTLAGGVEDLDQDFGYTGSGSIGDTIWEDTDGNGLQNGGETGLAGVNVNISVDFDGDGLVDYTGTATSDFNGNYLFNNLPQGTYTIEVNTSTVPGGYVLTGDPDANPDSAATVILPAGAISLDQDFGYRPTVGSTSSIGDTIYFDADGSGAQNGAEPGISGVRVTLNGDIDGNGTIDSVSTITDSSGAYLFDNLPEGDYTVSVSQATLPAGMSQTGDPDGGNDNTSAVTLAGGVDNFDQDFGYNGTGSLGDTIFFDGNNNGSQEANEGGIAGVQVDLDVDLNGDGVADYTYTSNTIGSDGTYLFENLPSGEYTIRVNPASLPLGMIQSSDPDSSLDDSSSYTLAGGENNLNQDFGYTGTGSIGDTIWNDADGDGMQNSGEAGIAGVEVTLTADGGGTFDYQETVTSDSTGNYLFENLPAGEYTITVDPGTLPTGMNQSGDPDGGDDNMSTVVLGADEDNLDQDFGYNTGTGSIGDTIYFDLNGNGAQEGTESGLPGVSITLTGDVDGDGTPETLTTITDSTGGYLFDNLAAGDYTITVDPATLPAGMNQTADPDTVNDNMSAVTLLPDEDNPDQDFGYQGTGSIGDTIWEDTNGDGVQNGTEPGLGGVDVTLSVDFDGDGVTDYTQRETTDATTGYYLFENLPEGEYTVAVDTGTVPSTYVLTGDPDANLDSTSTVTLPAGESDLGQDFGYRELDPFQSTGSIGDTIYFDENNSGTQDADDVGLPGVTVTLVGDITGDSIPDTVTTTTASDGSYVFDNLPAGNYTITVDPATLPAGMNQTADPDLVNDNTSSVVLAAGEENEDQDFGYTGSGVIGDTIYFDTDGDGTQDSGENGMPLVDVTLSVDFDGDGNPDYTATTTTDANGNYGFDNLPAGEYTVSVDTISLPGDVTPSGDPDSTLDNSATLSLGPGAVNNDQDFGYTGTGSIGDTVYYDADGNGYQSPGERGLPGVTVTLQGDFDNDGTIEAATTTTDANGVYLFDNLTAGDYTVYVDTTTLPGGMTQTADPDPTLDNQSVVTLGVGEANLDQDFGYGGPSPFPPILPAEPEPEPPGISVKPSTSAPTPSPGTPAVRPEPGLVADAFFMYRQFGDHLEENVFSPFDELAWSLPAVPVSPVYSGHAEPGTTLQFVLYDVMGNQIGHQSIMADTAGNWLASFPETILFDLPHHMEIEQTLSTYNVSSAGFFNMRTYFYPGFTSMVFSSTILDVETVFAYLPSTVMQSMHQSNLSTFDIKWNDFNGYEFLAPSTHPARNGH